MRSKTCLTILSVGGQTENNATAPYIVRLAAAVYVQPSSAGL